MRFIDEFRFSEKGRRRNRMTDKAEPLQPIALIWLMRKLGIKYFFDIGANVGYYSILASQIDGLQIFAFEAAADTFKELGTSIALNQLDSRILAINRGVYSIDGEQMFGVAGELSGANAILDSTFHGSATFKDSVKVPCITLSSFIRERLPDLPPLSRLAFKIDIEGAEKEALLGMQATLARNICLLQLEMLKHNEDEIDRIFRALNYRELCRIGPDHYFTNSNAEIDCQDLYEFISEQRIRWNAIPQNPLPLSERVQVRILVERTILHIEILGIAPGKEFNNPEFAIYIYLNNKVQKKFSYQQSSCFSLQADADGEYSISVYVREKDVPSHRFTKYYKFVYSPLNGKLDFVI